MRTARVTIPLPGTRRPRSQATLAAAAAAFTQLADQPPTTAVRFVGYATSSEKHAAHTPTTVRCAVYEADCPDTT